MSDAFIFEKGTEVGSDVAVNATAAGAVRGVRLRTDLSRGSTYIPQADG